MILAFLFLSHSVFIFLSAAINMSLFSPTAERKSYNLQESCGKGVSFRFSLSFFLKLCFLIVFFCKIFPVFFFLFLLFTNSRKSFERMVLNNGFNTRHQNSYYQVQRNSRYCFLFTFPPLDDSFVSITILFHFYFFAFVISNSQSEIKFGFVVIQKLFI